MDFNWDITSEEVYGTETWTVGAEVGEEDEEF